MQVPAVRDFIMVLTSNGEVATLPMHLIEDMHPVLQRPHLTQLYLKACNERPARVIVIHEPLEVFRERSEKLLKALVLKDNEGINHHLAPQI